MLDTLESGRDAHRRHAWSEAVEAFTGAESIEPLTADDLQLLAEAYWWSGRPDEAVETWERAHSAYVDAGRSPEAAIAAGNLAYHAFRRNAYAIGGGWMARAQRLLHDQPESPAHAWLKLLEGAAAIFGEGDLERAASLVEQALAIAQRQGVRDVEALATSFKGALLVDQGQWREGLRLVDEAAAAATSGELDLRVASDIYCNTIGVCRNLADYRRAGEWTDQAERWMRRQGVGGYPGVCRVYRAELKLLRGDWPEAEQEARQACDELARFHLLDIIGFARQEMGEVRRRMGDLAAAEESFDRAYEYGTDPQPGRSLLLLSEGRAEEAAGSIFRSLGGVPPGSSEQGEQPVSDAHAVLLTRAWNLPAAVEIALAVGDLDRARASASELEDIATQYESPALQAAAHAARGAVLLEEGRPEEAAGFLEKGWRLWQQIDLPYESARARVLLGKAHLGAGDPTAARLDLRAAHAVFERLGAALDVREVEALMEEEPRLETGARLRMTFMFTDIVTSTDLGGLIGDTAWEELLRWHDRTLRGAFARHHGEEVKHTGDGFFVAFAEAREAVECAVDVQRSLASHRREHGFAPWVRIGMHSADATRQAGDYSGMGVHAAARVGALADREEILVTAEVLKEAGTIRFPVSEPRSVRLKGITVEVEVRTVEWR